MRLPLLVLFAFAAPVSAADPPAWAGPMKAVRAKFTGTPGTLALFGDSITNSLAFWAPLAYAPKTLDPAIAGPLETVRGHMKPDCWQKWRGSAYGSESGQTVRWAEKNVDAWLAKLNPECAVVMFGTNDLTQLDAAEYEAKTRAVVEKCLKNGTVVILTTIPPRSGAVTKSKAFADVQRKLAADLKVPLIDYQADILKRRPDDWDGTTFKEFAKDVYQVPTLIAADGVHPSNPSKHADYTADALNKNGFQLRNVLTVQAYAEVIRTVLAPPK